MRSSAQGDLVFKKILDPKLQAKLHPKSEGPYQISDVLGEGSYVLANMKEQALSHAWNGDKLRKFYP
jgi:hypothetical protein